MFCIVFVLYAYRMSNINIIAQGASGANQTVTLPAGASIKELKKRVKAAFRLLEEDDIRLLYTNKELCEKNPDGEEQFLNNYDLRNNCIVFLVIRVHGGSAAKVYGRDIVLATEPDFITMDDSAGGQRAKMPCGHVVGPESLTDFCKSKLAAGGFEFRCEYKGSTRDSFCNAHWDFPTIKRMALLTDTEISYFETKIVDNYRKAWGIKECPKCKFFCQRHRNTDQRVKCPICSRKDGQNYEFCWFCLNQWRSSGVNQCGNSQLGCTGQDERLNLLKSCQTKEVIGVMCPKIRACPKCGLFIEHVDKCKHMACPCGTKFCFICLKKADDQGRYQCGASNFKCEVAPVQTVVPTL